MKKLLIALVLGILLVLALSTLALADNGPHGGFTATTEKCAGCHRAHSAVGPTYLLVAADIESLCLSCHDGTGAYTNVVDGYYVDTPIATLAAPLGAQGNGGVVLFGGGFSFTRMAHTWNGKDGYDASSLNPLPSPVTSAHSVDGTAGTVWGAGDISAATTPTHGAPLGLECTSCHDPHGRAGRARTATGDITGFTANTQGGIPTGAPMPSYRLLRFTPEGSNGFQVTTGPTLTYWQAGNVDSTAGITLLDTAAYWYTPNTDEAFDPNVQFYRSRWDGTQWTPWTSYVAGIGDLAGRNYVYQRPAVATSNLNAVGNGTLTQLFTCKDGSGNLPPMPTGTPPTATYTTYACGAATGTAFNNNTVNPNGTGRATGRAKLGYWCATCHDRYLANSGSRDAVSGDGYYMYRHNAGNTTPCVDCHVAHGTSAVMTATNATYPGASLTTGSILMKLDERSICLKCHAKDVNFAFAP